MKYRHKDHHSIVKYDLMLSEKDVNGLAVYSLTVDGQVSYKLFRPEDMIEVEE